MVCVTGHDGHTEGTEATDCNPDMLECTSTKSTKIQLKDGLKLHEKKKEAMHNQIPQVQ